MADENNPNPKPEKPNEPEKPSDWDDESIPRTFAVKSCEPEEKKDKEEPE